MDFNFLELNQKLARYFGTITRLKKNENPQPLLNYKVSKNPNSRKSIEILTKFRLFFEPKPPVKEDTIYKSLNTDPSMGYPVNKASKEHYQHQT